MPTLPAASALETLGLTPLEAVVYSFLCKESPASGYRIAQGVGKPIGNVYKAVEGLETKGAAMTSEDDGTRVVRAVPVAELVARLRRRFDQACTIVDRLADDEPDDDPDPRLYQLSGRETVLERARALIAAASRLIIANACPAPAAELATDLAAAARKRGVRVGLKSFAPLDIPGVDLCPDPRGQSAVDSGPGQWLVLIADGREALFALFDAQGDRLHQAFCTRNPLLVWTLFSGQSSDLLLAAARTLAAEGASTAAITRRLTQLAPLESPFTGGKRSLIAAYRSAAPRTRTARTP